MSLRGTFGCNWQTNDLQSLNPELLATNRSSKAIHSSTSSATYTPVTAVDMSSSLANSTSPCASIGGICYYGRYQAQVLGKRGAWDEVIEMLEENAVRARFDNFNKWRRTKDLMFEVPIIGHVFSTSDNDVSQSLHWPILNGKACVLNSLGICTRFLQRYCNIVLKRRYDPTCLYVSQGAALSAFGCGERHPLPLVLAPCSEDSSCNLCDELGEAFTDDSNAGRKVTNSSLPVGRP